MKLKEKIKTCLSKKKSKFLKLWFENSLSFPKLPEFPECLATLC